MDRSIPDPTLEPTLRVERAAAILGISRGSAYEGVANEEIPSIRIGRLIRVPTMPLLRIIGLAPDANTVTTDEQLASITPLAARHE